MRDTASWRKPITSTLLRHWQDAPSEHARILCDVELGLHLLERMAPEEPPTSLWALLTGYPFPAAAADDWQREHRAMLQRARHVLADFRSPRPWRQALDRYRGWPDSLRLYEVSADLTAFEKRAVAVCSDRERFFEDVLARDVPHRTRPVRWAGAGEHEFVLRGRYESRVIPDELVFPVPPPYFLQTDGGKSADGFYVSIPELVETARWMDQEEAARGLPRGGWERRVERLRLDLRDSETGELQASDSLPIAGLAHVIGMVSSGKSTLMDVTAVWAARRGLHVTIVVGDVVSALDRAALFRRLGLAAAPVLGASNRQRQLWKLHAAVAADHDSVTLALEHEGFRWLSTACPLDGLDEARRSAQPEGVPCLRLVPGEHLEKRPGWHGEEHACPVYARCPFHQAQLDLQEASIWVATPASLVYTRVAPQLCPERLRFAELVYRRSDLVLVDEADQVQVQLDGMFCPSQTLTGPEGGWLGSLQHRVVEELNRRGRGQVSDEAVAAWCQTHDILQAAITGVYARLLQSPTLSKWVRGSSYFTDWTLLQEIARSLGASAGEPTESATALPRPLSEFIDDPLNEESESELGTLAHRLIAADDGGRTRGRLRAWVNENRTSETELSDAALDELAEKVEFSLVVAVLQSRLAKLLAGWRQAEGPLGLETEGSALLHRPPLDYQPVIPDPPMGRVLAFQYLPNDDDPEQPGNLRFFRCGGVGRWLLLHLHELYAGDGIPGPHVLLLSGTSWAGSSPSYHVQTPVTGVLRAPQAEVDAIHESRFEFLRISTHTGSPVMISGRRGAERIEALREMLSQLARRNGFGGPGILEQERLDLPERRQRILLVVGSYAEAREARDFLLRVRPEWRGAIRHLVRDEREVESEWRGDEEDALPRGVVHQFAATGAWLLIAPLQAIERGHNILTEEKDVAAIGAAYFLVRPHSKPDDLDFVIHSMNQWALARCTDRDWLVSRADENALTFGAMGIAFRREAFRRWRWLLSLPIRYSTLPDSELERVIWSHLVTIWQVIGRLVRGGSPARVYFCDAAFAPRTSKLEEDGDDAGSSLLVGMHEVLRPYFDPAADLPDRPLVQMLYGPLFAALEQIGGLSHGTP
jgi:restriction endonuclease in pPIWI_RE module